MQLEYPVRFSVDDPDRPLDRLTTALRIFTGVLRSRFPRPGPTVRSK